MKIAIPDIVSNSYFPALAACELGFFRDQGLDVTVELMPPVDRSYAALRAGEVDLVAAGAHAGVSAFPDWRGMKLLCALSQGMYWFLVMRRDLGVQRGDLAAVRGRRIAAAPWVDLGLRRLLLAAGIDPARDGVEIAPVASMLRAGANIGVSAAQALADGLIDGFWANGMGAEVAVRSGAGSIVLDVRRGDGPVGCFGYTMPALACSDRLVEEHPDQARAAVRAIVRTHAALRQDPSRARVVGQKYFPPREADLICELIERDLPYYDAALAPEGIGSMNRFLRDMGRLSHDVAYDAVVAVGVAPSRAGGGPHASAAG